ncbi:MAG: hypothetical protein MJZ61_00340 [Bacteroidales bacterium]|nr:hypothetical protein [Bacteroidales bacterium]
MKKIAIILALAFYCVAAMAQDNTECAKQYSMYKEYMYVDSYDLATAAYREVFQNCPKFTKGIYADGIKIYKALMYKTSNPDVINAYVDTMKIIYSQKVKYYGEEWDAMARCGLDVMKYRKSDTVYAEAYHIFQKSLAARPDMPELSALNAFYPISVNFAARGVISVDDFFNDIVPSLRAVCGNIQSGADDKYKSQAESIIANLKGNWPKVRRFQPAMDSLFDLRCKLPDSIADIQVLINVMDILQADGCSLYARAAEKMYVANPTAGAAASIARYARKHSEWEKASKYYSEAAGQESDPALQSDYYYEWACVANSQSNYAEAVRLAKKSASSNPQNGAPLLLVSAIYMVSGNAAGDDDFSRRQVYWVAADYAAKAKKADPKLEEEANKLIAKCKAQFPKQEDAFMHSVKPGDSVTVKIFGSEATTARF